MKCERFAALNKRASAVCDLHRAQWRVTAIAVRVAIETEFGYIDLGCRHITRPNCLYKNLKMLDDVRRVSINFERVLVQ